MGSRVRSHLTREEMRRWENVGLAPTLELDALKFRWVDRAAKDFDVSGAITGVNLERTIEGASTLTVSLSDPDGKLMSATAKHVRKIPRGKAHTIERDEAWDRILAPNEVGKAMEVRLDGARFRLVKANASFGSNVVTLTFEDLVVYLLKRKRKPPISASRKHSTRAQFILRLVRELQLIRPPFVCPDLNVRYRVDSDAKVRGLGARKAGTSTAKGSVLNRRYPAHGLGASGVTRLTRDQVREAAAEGGFRGREIIGMEQIAHGESDYYPGVISSDGGHGLWQMTPRVWGAVALRKLDQLGGIAEMRNPIQCARMAKFLYDDAGQKYSPWFGTRYLTVAPGPGAGGTGGYTVGDEDAGGSATGDTEPRSKSYQFERKRDENSWAAIQRLASEVNRRAFVVGEAFYYISEDDLFSRRARYEITPDTQGIIDLAYDVDWGKRVSEATLTVTLDRWGAPPGSVVVLKDFGPPDGRWLIASVRRDWFSPVAEMTLRQPGRQLAEPAAQSSEAASAGGTEGGYSGDAAGKVGALLKIVRKFSGPYVYGGGHGSPLSRLSYSQGLDCSSSCSLALFKAGMWDSRSTPRTSGEFADWGRAGEGEQVTAHFDGAHVFLDIKGGGSIKRFDTSSGYGGGGGSGPRPRSVHRPAYGQQRHWPGT